MSTYETIQLEDTTKTLASGSPSAKHGSKSKGSKRGKSHRPTSTKTELVLKKLQSAKGSTIPVLMETTGWQAHSVRGFLSGTVKKKLGLDLISEIGKDGARRYRIDNTTKSS